MYFWHNIFWYHNISSIFNIVSNVVWMTLNLDMNLTRDYVQIWMYFSSCLSQSLLHIMLLFRDLYIMFWHTINFWNAKSKFFYLFANLLLLLHYYYFLRLRSCKVYMIYILYNLAVINISACKSTHLYCKLPVANITK